MTANGLTLHDLFAGALERFGDSAAVAHCGLSMSYRELTEQASRLAHGLRELSVGRAAQWR
jgi:non-ribosomal peptide synthetase component E (peptide arylation enzyme)